MTKKKEQKEIRTMEIDSEKRYRFCVSRSSKHVYLQIIDDEKGRTLVSASSLKHKRINLSNVAEIGRNLAEKASALGIKKVFFDRKRRKYCGIIKKIAEEVRAGGLLF